MATDKRTRLMDSSGENPSLGLELLPGSRGPLANPLDLGRRDPGASMHQEVRPGRHDPFPQIAADPAQSLSRSRLSLRVGPPFGEIEIGSRTCHVPGNQPGYRRHPGVPWPPGLVGVAIVAGPAESGVDVRRNLHMGLEERRRDHRRVIEGGTPDELYRSEEDQDRRCQAAERPATAHCRPRWMSRVTRRVPSAFRSSGTIPDPPRCLSLARCSGVSRGSPSNTTSSMYRSGSPGGCKVMWMWAGSLLLG